MPYVQEAGRKIKYVKFLLRTPKTTHMMSMSKRYTGWDEWQIRHCRRTD